MKAAQLQNEWHNRVNFDPDSTERHIESFWLKANDPSRRRALWIRFTLFANSSERHGATWAVLYDAGEILAAKETFPLERVCIDPERAGIGIGDCAFDGSRSHGLVHGNGFSVAWDFELRDDAPPHLLYPADWLYGNSLFPRKKTLCPHPDARFYGWVELSRNGRIEQVSLDGWRGMQGHVFGTRHIERYVWGHCNTFEDAEPPTYFDVGSGRVRVGTILTPVLTTGHLVLEGRTYRFDRVRELHRHESQFSPGSWTFTLHGPHGDLRGKVTSTKADTAGLTYENPHGTTAYCTTSMIASAEMELMPRRGDPICLRSESAALEVVQLDRHRAFKLHL